MEAMMEQQDERKIPPADLWDMKVAEGMSEDEATAYVAQIHGPPPKMIPAVRPDATMALQRERPDASGDWEAIPEGLKSAAAAAAMTVPVNRALGIATKGVMRYAPVAKAVGKALMPEKILKAARAGREAVDEIKTVRSIGPKTAPARTLEDALKQTTHNPRHRTQAQFDYFAERMAKRAAEQAKTEPSLEDLLAASLEQVKRTGSLGGKR